jgi:hypothetical protein
MLRPIAEIRQPLLGRWELMRNAVSQEAPVPGRASRRRRSVYVSHSSFAELEQRLTVRLTTSSRNAGVCRFAQLIGITSDPRITFPCSLKICASAPGLRALPAGFRPATASLA